MCALDFRFLIPYIPQLLEASKLTLSIGVLAFGFALLLSVVVGTLRSFHLPWFIRIPIAVYVEVFRGTPLLIQLFLIYYGLPTWGIVLEPFTAAVIGLSLNSGAYMSEVVRASILSVERGQYEAGYSLGYSTGQVYRWIVLPQAFRIALPTGVNYLSTLIKETSLVSVLSIPEITRVGNHIYARTLSPFEIFITIGAIYFVITYILALLGKRLERRGVQWSK